MHVCLEVNLIEFIEAYCHVSMHRIVVLLSNPKLQLCYQNAGDYDLTTARSGKQLNPCGYGPRTSAAVGKIVLGPGERRRGLGGWNEVKMRAGRREDQAQGRLGALTNLHRLALDTNLSQSGRVPCAYPWARKHALLLQALETETST